VGVTAEQRRGNRHVHPFAIGQHVVVPESYETVTFALDLGCPRRIGFFAMLSAFDLDDEPHLVARKVSDESANWYLAAKTGTRKTFPKQSPHDLLGIGG
jgi:hypothetical protein